MRASSMQQRLGRTDGRMDGRGEERRELNDYSLEAVKATQTSIK